MLPVGLLILDLTHAMAFIATGPDAVRIPLSMLVVFAAAKLLAELFERLRQPAIVGEILAGILIGPGVLGWMKPNDFLNALAELGVMFLLFRVGLEVRSSELVKVGGTAAAASPLSTPSRASGSMRFSLLRDRIPTPRFTRTARA